jgi:hypothetical protein
VLPNLIVIGAGNIRRRVLHPASSGDFRALTGKRFEQWSIWREAETLAKPKV